MRMANVAGRAHLGCPGGTLADIETASRGRFPPDPMELLDHWAEVCEWAESYEGPADAYDRSVLGPPIPRPRQVFAAASNYDDRPVVVAPGDDMPVVFTKFPSSIAGPYGTLSLPTSTVDWEVELVAVIGRHAVGLKPDDVWDALAGLMVGQDFSERTLQLHGSARQFSLGKSFPGFGPTGPVLVAPGEFEDPGALDLRCEVNGEVVQHGSASKLIYSVPELVSRISSVCRLFPGDLVFTGTPGGSGMHRTPPRYLRDGDVVVSSIGGIGELRTMCRSR